MKKDTNLDATVIPAYEGNYTKRVQRTIKEITIHHMAGRASIETCGKIFQKVGRNGSTHYGVGYDGRIGQYVEEHNIAWSNSNWESNCRAITIETSNEETKYWTVNDITLKSLINLVADIAKRNNLGKLYYGLNLTWHRMYAKTGCPGDYLISKMNYICYEANRINGYEEEDDIVRYQKIEDIEDSYWRAYAEDLKKRGILKGDENGNVDITIDMLRVIKMTERMK